MCCANSTFLHVFRKVSYARVENYLYKRGDASITFGEHLYKRKKKEGCQELRREKGGKLRQKRTEFESGAAGKPPNLPGIIVPIKPRAPWGRLGCPSCGPPNGNHVESPLNFLFITYI